MLADALRYFELGWSVIPLRGPNAGVKVNSPALQKWEPFQEKRASPELINRWFAGRDDVGVGVVCGRLSGVVVLDIDSPAGLEDAKARYGIDETHPHVVKSGGGGYHFYYECPAEELPNRVKFRPGLDFRADGGYVAAPGTLHKTGNTYKWTMGHPPEYVPPMPAQLLKDLLEHKANQEQASISMDSPIEKGNRDDELTRRIGRLVGRGLSYEDVLSLSLSLNTTHCTPPLQKNQVLKIVDSIFARENKSKKKKEEESQEDKPKKFDLKPFSTMAELYSEVEESWLVKDWMPSGTCALITSAPGMFKTWMMIDIAVAIATGCDFLGRYPVLKTGPVIIIQQEDPFPLLMERASNVMNVGAVEEVSDGQFVVPPAPEFPNIYFHTERSLKFSDKEIMKSFIEAVREIKPVAVILDPLYTAAGTDDYMASAAQDMLPLKKLRDEVGTSFIITHHMNKGKSEGGRSRDRLWGSQFLNAWLETGWQFEPSDIGSVEITRHFKNSASPEVINMQVEIGEGTFSVRPIEDGEEAEQIGQGGISLNEAVKQLVIGGKAASLSQIMSETGIRSKSTVSGILKKIGAVKGKSGYVMEEIV